MHLKKLLLILLVLSFLPAFLLVNRWRTVSKEDVDRPHLSQLKSGFEVAFPIGTTEKQAAHLLRQTKREFFRIADEKTDFKGQWMVLAAKEKSEKIGSVIRLMVPMARESLFCRQQFVSITLFFDKNRRLYRRFYASSNCFPEPRW